MQQKYEPAPRWGHTSVTIGDKVYMWGGRTEDFSESAKEMLSSVVEVFSLKDQCWEQKKTKGKPPLGLYNNASAAVGGNLYVYGGWDGHAAHNSLHRLHIDTLTWIEMVSGNVDELPMKMSGCGLVAFGTERLVLFGGYGLPSTTKSSTKHKGNVSLVTTSSKTNTPHVLSAQSSFDSGKIKAVRFEAANDTTLLNGGDSCREEGGGDGEKGVVNGLLEDVDDRKKESVGGLLENVLAEISTGGKMENGVEMTAGEKEGEEVAEGEKNGEGGGEAKEEGAELKLGDKVAKGEKEVQGSKMEGEEELERQGEGVQEGAEAGSVQEGSEGTLEGDKANGVRETVQEELALEGEVVENKGKSDEDIEGLVSEDAKNVVDATVLENAGREDEQEEDSEALTLIDKRWTNELKVYDLMNGVWSSPEVKGDCPPPCVDFSFDCINGQTAVLFGGYRPESGASSGAYLLDMASWCWTKLGDSESTTGKLQWPVGRDGHASCVLSELSHSQILITGGWDKDNTLLNDAWILDVGRKVWKKFSIPSSLGPRFWHRVTAYKYSPTLRQLLFFGGCPGAPMDVATGGSWEKLAATVLLEIGQVKNHHRHSKSTSSRREKSESEWIVVDSVTLDRMQGDEMSRVKERLLVAEHRALQAEALARKAEKIAKDAMSRLEIALAQISKSTNLPELIALPSAQTSSSPEGKTDKQPSWVISRSDVKFTPEELGKGRWGVVKVAEYKGEKVAARCLYSQITSQENQKVFKESMSTAAKIRHPNILPLIGAVMDGEPIILTRLMPTNLRKVLDAGKLQNYQIASVAVDIANGLLFLHSIKPDPVIHGDLPATSILVEKASGNHWCAKLSDFMTAKYFLNVVMSSGSSLDREDCLSPLRAISPPRSVTPLTSPSPLGMSQRTRILSGSDASINKKPSLRKQSTTAPDILDTSILTTQRDVYCYGLILVEICTGTPPLGVSFQFLTESITWSEMSAIIKHCTEYEANKRPSMQEVMNDVKVVHRHTTSRPSKLHMTIAS